MKATTFDALCVFLFICLCGAVVGSAGGAKWGTLSAGIIALFTVVCALGAAAIVKGEGP